MLFGYAERKSPGVYDVSFYQYGVSEFWGGKIWKLVARWETEMIDCDHARDTTFLRLFWFDGEVWHPAPICHEFETVYERITHEPACVPE